MTYPKGNPIAKDIGNWAEDKLLQWFDDVMSRYEMADIPPKYALVNTAAFIIDVASRAAANVTTQSPEECGKMFATLVAHHRKRLGAKP
jgi:hypothetical protein